MNERTNKRTNVVAKKYEIKNDHIYFCKVSHSLKSENKLKFEN